ncbi:MAG: lipid-A-disaccharide synthase [Elusimicrobia bacterium]|nr:lipid-A-disaccharide synthase [Elusimicrobiota bacterium]
MSRRILILAGDPSGDLHGARLAQELKNREPSLQITALGGPRLRQRADRFLYDLASLGISGFVEPLLKFRLWRKLLRDIEEILRTEKPSAVVAIDFYGFNSRALSLAKRYGLSTLYYISPQVWATRPGRIHRLSQLAEEMLVIIPFEVPIYQKAGLPCHFVGHPLLDLLPEPDPSLSPPATRPPAPMRIGLLPGSRPGEIRIHLPILVQAFRRLKENYPHAEGLLFAAAGLPDSLFQSGVGSAPPLRWVREEHYQQRKRLHLALTASGTASLENALLGIPTLVLYRLPWLSYLVARCLIRVPYISMINLLAQRKIAPELIQRKATAENLLRAARPYLENPAHWQKTREDLLGLREKLGERGAAQKAAEIILRKIHKQPAPIPLMETAA